MFALRFPPCAAHAADVAMSYARTSAIPCSVSISRRLVMRMKNGSSKVIASRTKQETLEKHAATDHSTVKVLWLTTKNASKIMDTASVLPRFKVHRRGDKRRPLQSRATAALSISDSRCRKAFGSSHSEVLLEQLLGYVWCLAYDHRCEDGHRPI